MTEKAARWAHYIELRPDQLQRIVDETPVAYWPLGSIEHHGWALPVGFDGLRPQRQCLRMVKRTGGVMLPVMWWGGGGGHAGFKWTFYQPMDAVEAIFKTTIHKLIGFGFKCIVPMPGHGPWSYILDSALPGVAEAHPDVLIVGAPGAPDHPPGLQLKGDHAARWETAYGLALLPELIDASAPQSHRDLSKVWPMGGPPPANERMPAVNFDETSPLFSQMGEDSRLAKAEDVEGMIAAVEDYIVGLVNKRLGRS